MDNRAPDKVGMYDNLGDNSTLPVTGFPKENTRE